MNRRLVGRMTATMMLAAGTLTALTVPATATPQPPAPVPAPDRAETMMEAMQRDLGLTRAQAEQRLADEADARRAAEAVKDKLDIGFGGFHYSAETGRLVVGVTERAKFDEVRRTGAKPRLVDDTKRELDTAVSVLNKRSKQAPDAVTGWYVDPVSNSVVVTTERGTAGKASKFVRASDVDTDAVRVVESAEQPRALDRVIGGQRYTINGATICSVGFAVSGGFVTAGHCGDRGDSTASPSGYFAGSSFPGNDYAFVSTGSDDVGKPWVDMYNGRARVVSGSQVAPVGSSVCRSGQTTGWHCGSIQAMNQTVSYPIGTVYGLTRTNVCAEPGDSGGSFISGNQAQGMTSGGSGNCTRGGVTYFQPVNEALNAYGLNLITG